MDRKIELITQKLFRVKENMKKIKFIIENSDITFELIQKASVLARKNEYHNFGHEIGATEQGIRIAIAEGRSREEINLIATALLFHDAGHIGIVRWYDEINSVNLTRSALSADDTYIIGSNHEAVMDNMQNLILATSLNKLKKRPKRQ